MRNVTVQNCRFSNVPRGIGSHTKLMGANNENIVIVKNPSRREIIAYTK